MNPREDLTARLRSDDLDVLVPAAREAAAVLASVGLLHVRRARTVDGCTLQWCRECQTDWPCATIEALDAGVRG